MISQPVGSWRCVGAYRVRGPPALPGGLGGMARAVWYIFPRGRFCGGGLRGGRDLSGDDGVACWVAVCCGLVWWACTGMCLADGVGHGVMSSML